jgi:hypothetical protein
MRQRLRYRVCAAVAIGCAVALVSGCGSHNKKAKAKQSEAEKKLRDEAELNRTVVNTALDQQVHAGITTGRTIYPHYFRADSAELNPLGEERVDILAGSLDRTQPVVLNMARGHVSDELYDARLATVRDRLVSAGVAESSIELKDALSGGEGVLSEDVLRRQALAQQQHGETRDNTSDRPGGFGSTRNNMRNTGSPGGAGGQGYGTR